MHLIHVRDCGTPETSLVSDLVRTHTSPGHENGPQAKLTPPPDTKTARKLSLRAVDLR